MSTEPNTGLTWQEAGSLTTDALHNQVVELLGVWLNCAVQSIGDTVPPGSPVNGQRFIVGASATGAWATHDGEMAIYRDGWQFYAPPEGASALNLDDGFRYVYLSGAWATASVAVSMTAADVAPAVVTEATSARTMDPNDAGKYIRYTGTGAKTCTFDDGDGFASGEEYHVANRGASGDVTLTEAGGMTLNAPKGGSLVLEPGDTVTVKMVAADEADVMGATA